MANSTVVRRQPPRRAARPPARPGRTRPGNRRRRNARRGPRRSFGPFVVIAVLIALVGLVWQHRGGGPDLVSGQCTVPGTNLSLSTEQSANASTIAAVARARGLPARATVIALATAQQESRLHNLDHGDRDSFGLFQQRPSQGWGTAKQVQDPVFASAKFFDHLVEVPGWETGRLTEVAQAVQRSGFPEAYQQWEVMAQTLTGALQATSPTALTCRFTPEAAPAPADERSAALTDAVRRQAGTPTVEPDGTVSVASAGWPEASWAIAHAEHFQLTGVSFDGWVWTPLGGWKSSPAAFATPLTLRL